MGLDHMQKGSQTLSNSYLNSQNYFLLNDATDIIDLHFKNIHRNNAVLSKFKLEVMKTVDRDRAPMPTEKEQTLCI